IKSAGQHIRTTSSRLRLSINTVQRIRILREQVCCFLSRNARFLQLLHDGVHRLSGTVSVTTIYEVRKLSIHPTESIFSNLDRSLDAGGCVDQVFAPSVEPLTSRVTEHGINRIVNARDALG